MRSSLRPTVEEINNFVAASVVLGAAFTAFSGTLTPINSAFYVGVGALILFIRELGQRTVAQWQDAYVDLQVSIEGAGTTIFGAIIAVVADWPFLLLFPVFSEFSGRSYEHWGKTIDAVWMKRQYWMVMGGVAALILGSLVSNALGLTRVTEALLLFLFFQLLPLDYHMIPTGTLDGAYMLRWSGFMWTVTFGAVIVAAVLTV